MSTSSEVSGSTSIGTKSDVSKDLNQLHEMFPTVRPMYIKYTYEESKGNLEATVEKLLDSSSQAILAPATNSPASAVVGLETQATTTSNSLTTAWSAVNTIASVLKETLSNGGHFQQGSSSLQQQAPRSEDESITALAKVVTERKQIMVILRGLPGSGKSYLAKKLKSHFHGFIASADDYFMRNGDYTFNPDQLSDAHKFCREKVEAAARDHKPLIIVDNTNLEAWEMLPYVKIALDHRYHIVLLEPPTEWKYKPSQCAYYNRHGVPLDKISRQNERFDRNLTVEKLIQIYRRESSRNNHFTQSPHPVNQQLYSSLDSCFEPQQQQQRKPQAQQQQQQQQQQQPSVRPKTTFRTTSAINPNPPTIRSAIKSYSGHTDWRIPSYPVENEQSINDTKTPPTRVCDSSCQTNNYAQISNSITTDDVMMIDEPMVCDEICSNVREVISKGPKTCFDKATLSVLPVEQGPMTRDDQLQTLLSKFPDVELDTLSDIIDVCNGNIQWAINVLSGDASDTDDVITLSDDSPSENGSNGNFNSIFGTASAITRFEDEFTLEIPTAFAHDLEMAFGLVSLDAFSHRKLRINSNLAKEIYDIWAKQCQSSVPNLSSSTLQPPKGEFEEQLQLEQALHQSKSHNNSTINPNLAELYRAFPGCAEEILDQIYFENDKNLKKTIEAVEQQVAAGTSNENGHWSKVAATVPRVSPTNDSQDTGDYFIEDESDFSKLRTGLLEKRAELFEQKRNALDNKKIEVASYYTSEINNINREYQRLINAFVQFKTNTFTSVNHLDLHGNTVKEANSLLKAFIASKQKQLNASGSKHIDLEIVTGWGLHSPKMKGSLYSSTLQTCKQMNIEIVSKKKGSFAIRLYKSY